MSGAAEAVFELTEHSTSWVPTLEPDQASALQASGAVAVSGAPGGGWNLRTTHWVGVVRHADVEVRVSPKVPVARLLFLLGFAADPTGWRDDPVAFGGSTELVDAFSYAFITLAERSLKQGVLQGYVHREEALPFMRGRLRTGDQLARRSGLALPVEVSFDDYTSDIPENRVLLSAAHLLLRAGVPRPVRSRFSHLLGLLESVTPWPSQTCPPAIRWTRLNRRYEPAVHLALLILRGASYQAERGGTQGSGFLFDMDRIFEDFLGAALTRSLQRFQGEVELQHRSHLDEGSRVRLRPDITWWREGRCVAIVDAKYRALPKAGNPNEDLYQLLAYCTAYGVPEGHLIYAHAEPFAQRIHQVRNARVNLRLHAVGLDRPPDALLDRVDQIAQTLGQHHAASSADEG